MEIVPTLVLRMYDEANTEVFTVDELEEFCGFLMREINGRCAAVYDVYPRRGFGAGLPVMAGQYPSGLIRVGLQPGEVLGKPFTAGVQDTWSAFCHGETPEDWRRPGFGADALRSWVRERNAGRLPVSWNLIAVAWDYSDTEHGEYPGYDDADKNMPLPAGRNAEAARLILSTARPKTLAGFSSDLLILNANSASKAHDGLDGSFYRSLREGKTYTGYYSAPLAEIAAIYKTLQRGKTQPDE